jgi:two-component system chemotaxis sensor kinase CheA
MSENEKLNLIFLPGLSTAKTVTDISGRGVGMDVVRTNINKLGGHVDIRSMAGKGTTVHVVIPLTLAIIPSLMVGAGEYRFAIPQINVQEVVSVRAGDPNNRLEMVGGSEVLRLRERLLPIIRFADVLGIQPTFIHPDTGKDQPDRRQRLADQRRQIPKYKDGMSGDASEECDTAERRQRDFDRRKSPRSDIYIVVLRAGMSVFGLHVNHLFDNEEIVVKPLSKHVKDSKCFAGATIMGDGRVAMILDAAGIASHSQLRFGELEAEERRRRKMRAAAQEALKKRLQAVLMFTNDPEEYFAMPLAEISRLEMTEPRKIEHVGDQEFLSYRRGALPLIRLEKFLPIRPIPKNAREICIIIPKTGGADVGIIASRILDTTETDAAVRKDATTVRGVRGSAIIDDRLVLFLDTESLIALFEERVQAPRDENGILS